MPIPESTAAAICIDRLQYIFPFKHVGTGKKLHLRFAVERGCRLSHVELLVGSHPGDAAIVFDPDQQAAPVGIGECREGSGDFTGIVNLEFKIQFLVFFPIVYLALCHQENPIRS